MMHFFTTVVFILACLTLGINGRRSALRHHPHHRENSVLEIFEEEEDKRLALMHSQRVSEATKCDMPKMQVIHVNDHYPGKYYLPHCTLLHRCGKHAGCCAVESLKCVAAEKEKVTLYFYSVKLDGGELKERKIEKLVFTNHTRCACAPVDYQN